MKTSVFRANRSAALEREMFHANFDFGIYKVKSYSLGTRHTHSAKFFETALIRYQRKQFTDGFGRMLTGPLANRWSGSGGSAADLDSQPAAQSFVFFTSMVTGWPPVGVAPNDIMGGGGRGADIGVDFITISFAFFAPKTHKLDTGPNNVGGGGGGGQTGDLIEQPAPLTFDFFVPMDAPVFDPVAVAISDWSGGGGATGGMNLPVEVVTFEFFESIVPETDIGPVWI